jgi:DNA-binding transcriptional MocR family regulator
MLHQTMDSPAWLALSPWAKALYPLLKRRAGYGGNSNGRVHLSVREAATYLNAHRNTAAKAFHELQARGFIVPRRIGTLGTTGAGVSTAWRLTELGTSENPRPTKEYLRWQPGADFIVQKGKPPPKNGNPSF